MYIYGTRAMSCCPFRGVGSAAFDCYTYLPAGAELLKSEAAADRVAEKLTQIAVDHGFDGWLINIENKVDPGRNVDVLVHFVKSLTAQMRRAAASSGSGEHTHPERAHAHAHAHALPSDYCLFKAVYTGRHFFHEDKHGRAPSMLDDEFLQVILSV